LASTRRTSITKLYCEHGQERVNHMWAMSGHMHEEGGRNSASNSTLNSTKTSLKNRIFEEVLVLFKVILFEVLKIPYLK
jgi:hypothetical protein